MFFAFFFFFFVLFFRSGLIIEYHVCLVFTTKRRVSESIVKKKTKSKETGEGSFLDFFSFKSLSPEVL